MVTRSHKTRIAAAFIAGLSSLFFAAGCTSQIGLPPVPGIPVEEVTATEEIVDTTTPAPATAEAQPEETSSPTPEATEPVRLTLWTIEAVSPLMSNFVANTISYKKNDLPGPGIPGGFTPSGRFAGSDTGFPGK